MLDFEDVVSQLANSKITPGGIGVITGEELKFDPANDEAGIFFVADGGKESKVSVIARRTEGNLMFSIPSGLAAGEYQLEVRKSYKNGKTLRVGALPEPLNVS